MAENSRPANRANGRGTGLRVSCLVPPKARRAAIVSGVAAVVLFWLLTAYSRREPTTVVDRIVGSWLKTGFRWASPVLQYVTVFDSTRRLMLLTAGVAAASWFVAGWRGLLFATGAPFISIAAAELVLKPLTAPRDAYSVGLAFPSGHATAATSLALVVIMLLWNDGVRRRKLAGWVRAVGTVVTGLLPLYVAVALVVLDYHRPTDVLGGALVAVVIVIAVALLLDARIVRHAFRRIP